MSVEIIEGSRTYKVRGVSYPRVTTILNALRLTWYPDDPAALARGTAVHEACRFLDENDLDRKSLDPMIVPYVDAWEKCKRELNVQIVSIEKPLLDPLLGYGGTPDRVLRIGGELFVGDLKTGEIADSLALQEVAYGALISKDKVIGRIGIQLKPDGTYSTRTFPAADWYRDWRAWLGCMSLYQWKNWRKVK